MTLLSEASFLVTPNGYKEDKLYAAIPTNGDGDMTFTRATPATRVNEAGLVELVPYNLLLRSQEFDNAVWTKSDATITANTIIAPDGTLTGDKIVENTATNFHFVSEAITTAAAVYTYSVYVKAAERNWVVLLLPSSAGAYFDLSTGTIGTVSSGVTANITSVGNGWYRCSLTRTLTAISSSFSVYLATANNSANYAGNGYSGIYVWGAQVVEGSSALTYQKTVDRLDIPRIDYTGGGCPSILLEPQRTNLLLRSEEFDNAAWSAASVTATASSGVSPDGTNNAYLINVSVPSSHNLKQSITVTASTAYVFSFWAKRGTITNLTYSIYDNSAGANILLTNYYSQTNSSTWTRINIPFTTPVGCTNIGVYPIRDTPATGTFYLYGAQVEAGAYPTSYIPTVASTVTRLVDSCHLLNHSLFTDYPFTVYGKAEVGAVGNTIFSLNNTSSSTYYLAFYFANSIQVGLLRRDLSNNDSDFYNFVYSAGDTIKVAVAFISPTAYKLYINGTEIADVTSGASIPFNHNDISLGQFRITGDTGIRNSINEFMVFNEALSDSELQTLTTL